MSNEVQNSLLRALPSVDRLVGTQRAEGWIEQHPRALVVACIRETVDELRRTILADEAGRCGAAHVSEDAVLMAAEARLAERTQPHVRKAINATGIILHTGLGRAVWPESVASSMAEDLSGYVSLAIDRASGKRSDRDGRVEYILTELTGAEAATVVNNNAAATVLVLAALAAGREVVISRGQLIEIGGSFRLPDVIATSGAKMVEVGTTNRTHLRDYEGGITESTAALLRVHPSNYRVVGFSSAVDVAELAELARQHGLIVIDDIGAGALVGLERYGLPHEPTVGESVAAGADLVLFSGDKLIGAGQAGIIVGRRELIERIRKHPLARAMRIDKSCLTALERTLVMFRDPDRLAEVHPTYRMLAASVETLVARAAKLAAAIGDAADVEILPSQAYLGSGSLPTEALASFVVAVAARGMKAEELARRLRMDGEFVVGRIESDRVCLDVRTLSEAELPRVAAAVRRCVG